MNVPTLRLAVCLFPGVTTLDYAGPVELLSFISPKNLAHVTGQYFKSLPKYAIEPTYLAYTLDDVEPVSGPLVKPSRTYADAEDDEFDILLVPGGPGADPSVVEPSLLEFLRAQAPRVRYILSVCGGSWTLAHAGLLNGKRATSNKAGFREIKRATQDLNITWVTKARWVVDSYDGVEKKLWTSSGVTAGMDLAYAFLDYLLDSKEHIETIKGIIEFSPHEEGDDPFAAYWNLEE